jgi:hypothetical protein
MVTGGDVELAIMSTLRAWLPSYLAECDGLHGDERGTTPVPRGWAITGRDLQKLTSDQLPCVVIMAGGIIQAPVKEGGTGPLTAVWGVDVGVVFAAAWGRSSRAYAQRYAASLRTLLQQRPLDELPSAVDWRGEVYDEMDFADSRSYSASVCSFNVEVREVGWADGGPPPLVLPPQDPTVPFDGWVEVAETEADVEHIVVPESLP